METLKELIDQLNNLKIEQHSIDWAENIPQGIWDEHFKGKFKPLKSNLDPDTRRWYETSISVIELYGKPIGVRHITNLFSESSSCEDCCQTMVFFEMEPITVTSYSQKK